MPDVIATGNKPEIKIFKLSEKPSSVGKVSASIREVVDDLMPEHSAILFKGLPVENGRNFNDVMEGTGYEQMKYVSGAGFRTKHVDKIYEASLEPPEFTLECHNEMAYMKIFPDKVSK